MKTEATKPIHPTQLGSVAFLRRKCACGGQAAQSETECEDCKTKKTLQKKAAGPPATTPAIALPIVHEVLNSPGQPLDSATREFFEPRFGHDFSRVRVHTDDRAARSARAVDAAAYTVGKDIVFDANRYRPLEDGGVQLFAHELTHVTQQESAGLSALRKEESLVVGQSNDRAEREADDAAKTLGAHPSATHGAPVLRRQPKKDPPPPAPTNQPAPPVKSAYSQALSQIQTLDPLMHGFLSKAPLNGASTPVRIINATDSSTPTPTQIQITFNLVVKEAALAANLDASFNGGVPVIAGQGTSKTVTANMEMSVNKTSSTALAENLFHEGVHMLLFMDDLVPGGSPHGAALANYKKIAAANPDFAPMNSQLATLFATKLNLKQPLAQKQASDLVDDVLEEKYVRDQEATKFNAPFSNRALAATQILKDLADVGVVVPTTDVAFQSIAQAAARIMDDIDQKIKAAQTPAPPVQAPQGKPQGQPKENKKP